MSPKDLGHNPLLFSLFDLPQGAMPQVLEIGKSTTRVDQPGVVPVSGRGLLKPATTTTATTTTPG